FQEVIHSSFRGFPVFGIGGLRKCVGQVADLPGGGVIVYGGIPLFSVFPNGSLLRWGEFLLVGNGISTGLGPAPVLPLVKQHTFSYRIRLFVRRRLSLFPRRERVARGGPEKYNEYV